MTNSNSSLYNLALNKAQTIEKEKGVMSKFLDKAKEAIINIKGVSNSDTYLALVFLLLKKDSCKMSAESLKETVHPESLHNPESHGIVKKFEDWLSDQEIVQATALALHDGKNNESFLENLRKGIEDLKPKEMKERNDIAKDALDDFLDKNKISLDELQKHFDQCPNLKDECFFTCFEDSHIQKSIECLNK